MQFFCIPIVPIIRLGGGEEHISFIGLMWRFRKEIYFFKKEIYDACIVTTQHVNCGRNRFPEEDFCEPFLPMRKQRLREGKQSVQISQQASGAGIQEHWLMVLALSLPHCFWKRLLSGWGIFIPIWEETPWNEKRATQPSSWQHARCAMGKLDQWVTDPFSF